MNYEYRVLQFTVKGLHLYLFIVRPVLFCTCTFLAGANIT